MIYFLQPKTEKTKFRSDEHTYIQSNKIVLFMDHFYILGEHTERIFLNYNDRNLYTQEKRITRNRK